MESSKELLLVHKKMKTVSLSETVNVMLTPQFYDVKKEALPVKYAYQAKRLAPSLFEGYLEKDGTYDYYVYKEGQDWVFIAYDLSKIIQFLETKGLTQENISKIFFVQQSVSLFESPFLYHEDNALLNIDGIVAAVPSLVLEEQSLSVRALKKEETPKGGIGIDKAVSFFSMKETVIISSVFVIFALMYMVEGTRYGGESKDTQEVLQSLYDEYPSLQSAYTREGILNKYREQNKNERAKREAVKKLSTMIFKGVTLTSLQVDKKSIQANVTCDNQNIVKRVEKLAKTAQFSVKKIKGKYKLQLEGLL